MSAFLYELGRNCYRARKRVLAIWLAVLVLLGALALLLGGKYSDEFEKYRVGAGR